MFFAPQTILDKKTSHHDIFDVIHDVNVKRHRGNSYVIMTQTCLLENSRKMASVSLRSMRYSKNNVLWVSQTQHECCRVSNRTLLLLINN